MDLSNLAVFQAMGAKMNFLSTRQGVIAQNVANADTPNYRPRDLKEVDFGAVLKEVTGSKQVRMEQTSAGHIAPGGMLGKEDVRKARMTYEVAPAGNAVILEEQMVKASRTTADYSLMTNLMRKNVGLIQTALGRNGQ